MATAPVSLDKPPQQPPSVTAQQGAPPQTGDQAASLASSGPAPAGAEVHPQGALLASRDAVVKVLDQMSKQSDPFGPYGARAIAIINEGVGVAIGGTDTSSTAPTDQGQSAAPPDQGQSFPG